MRKVIALIHQSLDGFAAGPNDELNWIAYDDELERDAHAMHDVADAVIWGRRTYEGMASYWLTVPGNPDSTATEREHARWLQEATKIVVSRTLDRVEWNGSPNTVLIRDNVAEAIHRLKHQPGKALWFLGSLTLAQTFIQLGLIDEYRINVNPTIMGRGKRLFQCPEIPQKLDLVDVKRFKSGVVGLRYVVKA